MLATAVSQQKHSETQPCIPRESEGGLGDRWVSLYIFVRVGFWGIGGLILKGGALGLIRSTQPTSLSIPRESEGAWGIVGFPSVSL